MTFEIAPPRRGRNPLSDLEATRQGVREQRAVLRKVVFLSCLALALAAACVLLHIQASSGARPEREEPAILDVLAPERPEAASAEEAPAPAEEPEAPPATEAPPAEPSRPARVDFPTIEELKRQKPFRAMVEPKERVGEINAQLLLEWTMDVEVLVTGQRVVLGADKIEPRPATHIFTWLQGQTPESLQERARDEAARINPATGRPWGPLRCRNLRLEPEPYRGRILRFEGSIIKVAGIVAFPEDNPSGVRDTTMVFARASASAEKHIFLLPLPPDELMDLTGPKTKLIQIDGVFMKEYLVEKKDGTEELMPLVLALGYRRVELPASSPWMAAGIVAAAVLFGAFIFAVALREMRGSRAVRRAFAHRRLARRAGSGAEAGGPQAPPAAQGGAPPASGSPPPDGG